LDEQECYLIRGAILEVRWWYDIRIAVLPARGLMDGGSVSSSMCYFQSPRIKEAPGPLWWVLRENSGTHLPRLCLGVDPKVVAHQQGHTLDVNLNVYTETSLESRIDAVETLGSALVNW